MEKSIAEHALDAVKLVLTLGGLALLWNVSGTLSSIQTEIKGFNHTLARHDSRITFLERKNYDRRDNNQ